MPKPYVTIRNLHKAYTTPAGSLAVLGGIDLDINQGEFVAIVGASGVGKTTLLNMLTAVDTPDSGEIIIGERSVTDTSTSQTKWRAKNIGIVFQMFQLLPTLSVAENVVFPMDFTGTHKRSERHAIALNLLDQFGIADQAEKTPDMLSGGQQQRVAIARAMANHPPLLIGDEPTANLDRMSASNAFNTFQSLADKGATVIITTHDRDLVKNVSVVYELANGKLSRVENSVPSLSK
ncbi:MAG: ABC transporter ATP-binding protein [Anaerolineae bacterium]